ncbi:MAG TPA: endonuclease domain-containing protein [Bacteroidia bacterium]|jgi:very-short-patch-repair endonuclease|nr:endonuclease domain-containing protein [Bacteroidia bacterium]
MKNKLIPYNPRLKEYARKLRKAGNLSEVILWKEIKRKALGVEFHRQVPIDDYIVDFYCHELMLAIEVDGSIHELKDIKLNDIKRQNELEKLGVKFIRFKDFDVKNNLEFVLRALKKKVEDLKSILTSPATS